MPVDHALTAQTVDLLQQLIRNQCVNDGTVASGQEVRTTDVLRTYLQGSGLDVEVYEPDGAPGRASLVARIVGSDPNAPTLCLMGHTDVVPVNSKTWTRDPFGASSSNGEVWGRGAVDMLNLTASQAVALKTLARRGWRPKGDLGLSCLRRRGSGRHPRRRPCLRSPLGCARRRLSPHRERSGTVSAHGGALSVTVHVGEKGVAWRRLKREGHSRTWLDALRRGQCAREGRARGEPAGGLPAPRRTSTSCGPASSILSTSLPP